MRKIHAEFKKGGNRAIQNYRRRSTRHVPKWPGVVVSWADRIKAAYNRTLADGCLTRDLGGELDTQGFVDALIERIEASPS